MDRHTKIQLLDHWLSNPESLGDIPKEFEERVTTRDFFDIKREMDWKPLTKENVERLLHKTKYLGTYRGTRAKTRGNPKLLFILAAVAIITIVFRMFSESISPFGYSYTIIYILFGLIFMGIFLRASLHELNKK